MANVGDVLEIGGRLDDVAPDKQGCATLEPALCHAPQRGRARPYGSLRIEVSSRPFAEHWNGDKWTIKKLPVPRRAVRCANWFVV